MKSIEVLPADDSSSPEKQRDDLINALAALVVDVLICNSQLTANTNPPAVSSSKVA